MEILKRKKPNYWTLENCLASAREYETVKEWRENDNGAYQKTLKPNIRNLGWHEQCTAHMKTIGSKMKRCIYIFYVPGFNFIYVGLTYFYEERQRNHKKGSRPFIELLKQTGTTASSVIFKKLTPYEDVHIAQDLEGYVLKSFIARGYFSLNKGHTGNIGGSTRKWTKEKVIEAVKKSKNRDDFYQKYSGAYQAAKSNDWLDECLELLLNSKPAKSLKECLISAKKFQYKFVWQKNDKAFYLAAWKNRDKGWFTQCTAHMDEKQKEHGYWTKDKCIEDASKYTNLEDWKAESGGAVSAASSNGWWEECTAHMDKGCYGNGYWTRKRIEGAIALHPNFKSLKKDTYAMKAYRAANHQGILREIQIKLGWKVRKQKTSKIAA